MTADVPTMVFGNIRVYRVGLSGRLGRLTRSVNQEVLANEGGKWGQELAYVLGAAKELYPSSKGAAPTPGLVPSYTRDLGHDGWSVRRFWEAQPDKLRGSPEELSELEVVMLRLYTGPIFVAWNFFLRYGPGVVLCCTDVPYHEHHNPALVFCPRSDGEQDVCMCGKRLSEHFEQPLDSWATCVAILYSAITILLTY